MRQSDVVDKDLGLMRQTSHNYRGLLLSPLALLSGFLLTVEKNDFLPFLFGNFDLTTNDSKDTIHLPQLVLLVPTP